MKEDIEQALKVLKSGGVILYPTDTVWGLGCDAVNAQAVQKIYQIKKREESKSMIILLENINLLYSYVREVPEVAVQIAELADKPTTVIYPEAKNLASNLINQDKSIAVRITSDKFCSELLRRFRKPIVSTSANISGEASPENFSQIPEEIKNQVDFTVKYRQDDMRKYKPSSIIKIGLKNEVTVIRL
jgi:L-threonylcarbamoyladenylate synthase